MAHSIHQGDAKLKTHGSKVVNQLKSKVDELSHLVRAQSATMAQHVNLVYSFASQVRNLPALPRTKNKKNSCSNKHHQPGNNRNNDANAHQQVPKP